MYGAAEHPRADQYRTQAEHTIGIFERSGIAVFPSTPRRKGTYVAGWQTMAPPEATAVTRGDLRRKLVNLAGRTGNLTAVFDLDAKNGVDPSEMLQVLLRLLAASVIAIVRTSRGFQIWIRVAAPVGNGFCSFIGGEIFSDPHLAMLPPSVHPDGHEYSWQVEPRAPGGPADLKSLGLVPDKRTPTKPRAVDGEARSLTSAAADTQQDFVHLMSDAGVARRSTRSQTLELCPWHDDRSPSLSVNWDAAVYYCFSEHCQARGGINSLRRTVRGDTPSYRHGSDVGSTSLDHFEADHLSGDKLGCSGVDAAAERLAGGLESLGLDARAVSVRDCRKYFRVAKCTSCARTPAFPISCSDPLCVRCMPGRLAADWARHSTSFPPRMNIVRLCPRDIVRGSPDILRKVRSRFREWRRRAGLSAGIYGARLDVEHGAVILLAIPSEVALPEPSRAFDVEVMALDRKPEDFLSWLQREYVGEAQSWKTPAELAYLVQETHARRRFQGFGAVYGESTETEGADKEAAEMAKASETEPEGRRKALGRISGGSFKGKHARGDPACPFCGGAVELYPFTVPAAEVNKVGKHWLWGGASAGSPEGRRYAR